MTRDHARCSAAAGTDIIRQGDKGDCAYLLEQGLVEILVERPNGTVYRIGTRGPGTVIGEMAIVDHGPRTATVRAVQPCVLLKITGEDFDHRLEHADPVLRLIIQVILGRYRDTLRRAEILSSDATSFALEGSEHRLSDDSGALAALRLASELRSALDDGDLSLRYQPLVAIGTGAVTGFEALMRWTHRERGPIPPDVFIAVAEETGLIAPATDWALGEACGALGRIEAACPNLGPLYMSVNFSGGDFASDGFVRRVGDIAGRHGTNPRQLRLEITERVLMGHPDEARTALDQCRRRGMTIAIDDFGTGYSSLSYLHYFPIDALKIDRSFVVDMHRCRQSLELVRSILGIGKSLRLTVVAEGVETEEDLKSLRDLGCDQGQGYLFSKPLAEGEAVDFLKGWQPAAVAG